ncbi:class I SAM-dependent methyltransferase [Sphingobacterium faecium]|uniref:class I SAM-dependent DNA methyltransferase n=1 Tax=Sphingobacterium faecium TaxID=34087 RepID=UPI00320A69E3
MEKDLNIQFYDELADDYHLIFDNWNEAISKQASTLQQIIKTYAAADASTILDCACGIGTQAIGLAALGYQVWGTDLSPKAIDRAKLESDQRGLPIPYAVADFRSLEQQVTGVFDVVIACDNALPHLLDEHDMLLAAKSILTKMKSGSLFIGSIRDYDKILENKPVSTPPTVKNEEGKRTISFQVWDWIKQDVYIVNHFTLKGKDDQFETNLRKTKYRAYRRTDLTNIFDTAGFVQISWLMPQQSGYYQPIFIGKKP